MNIVRVGDRSGVVERPADVAPSLIGIALMLDGNDPIVVGLDEPASGIGFVTPILDTDGKVIVPGRKILLSRSETTLTELRVPCKKCCKTGAIPGPFPSVLDPVFRPVPYTSTGDSEYRFLVDPSEHFGLILFKPSRVSRLGARQPSPCPRGTAARQQAWVKPPRSTNRSRSKCL